MAISLINETTAYLRTDDTLTAAERLVLLLIADRAHERTREAWPGGTAQWDLRQLAGLTAIGLRNALQRLARRGLEVRVARGKDANGQPVYAYRGAQTTYRLPDFPEKGDAVVLPFEGDGRASPNEKGDVEASQGDAGASQSRCRGIALSLSPSEPVSAQRAEDLNEEDTARILAEIRRRRPEAGPGLQRIILAEDGPTILAELESTRTRQDRAQWLAALDGAPECPHGVRGGHVADEAGWVRCPIERQKRKQPLVAHDSA